MKLSPLWVPALSSHGFEARHWHEIGAHNAEDRAIFDYAQSQGAIILTQDLDFSAILAQTNAPLPSVVLLRFPDVDPAHASNVVVSALKTCASELAKGAILSIDEDGLRARLLPLHPDASGA